MRKQQLIYGFLIVVSLSIIGYSLTVMYAYLGGDEDIKVYRLDTEPRYVAGRSFVGKQTDPRIEKFFTETRAMLLDSSFTGELTVITYQDDTLESNQLNQFIGIIMDGDMAEIPMGYEVREFGGSTKLAVYLAMHPFVMPSPDEIQQLFNHTADSLGLELAPYSFEIHYQDNSLSVEAWTVD